MDFLNKSLQQITDVFKSMTPGARITSGLLVAVIVVSLVYLVQVQTTATDNYLFGGREFSQSELTNMAAAFGQAKLGDFDVVGYRVRVPADKRAAYLGALADANALPSDFSRDLEKTLTSQSLFPVSREVMKEQLEAAKEKNLSLIIREMRNIQDSRVQFETEKQPGLRGTTETRAIAAVRAVGNRELTEQQVDAIRNTVVAGVAGLEPENVTVTDWNGSRTYQWTGKGSIAGVPNSEYIAHKRFHENDWRQRILSRLVNYPGAIVEVDVELETELEQRTQTHKFENTATPIETIDTSKIITQSGGGSGGVPGVPSNSGNANQPAVVAQAKATESNTEEIRTESKAVPSETIIDSKKPGLVPKRVTTSIGIPRSYYVRLWKEQNKPAEGEEQIEPTQADIERIKSPVEEKIKDSIAGILPRRIPGEDPYEHVVVQMDHDFAPEVGPTPGITAGASTWLASNWQNLGMILFGVFSLLMLRSMVQSSAEPAPGNEPTPQLQTESASGAVSEEDDFEDEEEYRLRFESTGPNLRSELTRLVKDDPESAANVLKNWIGEAA